MNVKLLSQKWSTPDFLTERHQLSVRIDYDSYAKLLALRAIYPKQSINDMVSDILKLGLDELVDFVTDTSKLREEAEETAIDAKQSGAFVNPDDIYHALVSPIRKFHEIYRSVIDEKINSSKASVLSSVSVSDDANSEG